MLFQNNYVKVWNEVEEVLQKWEKLQLPLLGRIATIKVNVLPRMLLLFQTIPIVTLDLPFRQWQRYISKFIWQVKKPRVKVKILQAKERGGLRLLDLKTYFFACCLMWIKD